MGNASTERLLSEVDGQGKEWLLRALGLGEDQNPFPWQLELLRSFCRGDDVQALDIPTGLGKTATIAIWLIARALGAKLPRRLVYVVDRRAVVDQATEEAERIRKVVDETPELKAALGLARSLPISTLRGRYVDNREWLEDPSLPAIVVGTVDMVGSRLLFDGYRWKMRPYHAALLGVDALIVLDEAHLVPAFGAMVRAVAGHECLKPQITERHVVPPRRVLSLSATGRAAASALQLGDCDQRDEVVQRRLNAKKCVRIEEAVEADALAEALGRVNRRGEGEADVYGVPTAIDDKTEDALAKEEKILALRYNSDDVADGEDDEDGDGAGNKRPKRLKEDERNRVDRWNRKVATLRAIASLPLEDGVHDASPRELTELKRDNAPLVAA